MTTELQRLLDQAVPGVFPAATAHVAYGEAGYVLSVGTAETSSVWDLASLTKPMAVATLLMWAVDEGTIALDDVVFGRATVEQLAGHTSGLPAHRHFYQDGDVRGRVLVEPLAHLVGEAVYSDLGYMMLGWFLEERLGDRLDVLFERVRTEFGLDDTGFLPSERDRIMPTEDCGWRGRVLVGEVHDGNAWALGGVAGHAGLFGTAGDVHRWASALLDAWHGRPAPVSRRIVRRFLQPRPGTTWRLGFDSVSEVGSSAGVHFGPKAFGHLGFTGTSVWVEPEREWVVVLLSNRVHPVVLDNPPIKRFRPAFHNAFAKGALPAIGGG